MSMEFYIHIGTGKTGTSAIQVFLDTYRLPLVEQFSCLYPNLKVPEPPDYFSGHCPNHCNFFRCENDDFINSQIKKLICEAERKNIQKIILSCEALSNSPKFAHSLHKTLSNYSGIRTFIIVYLRRQDHWLESAWKQWGCKDKQFRDVNHFLSNYQRKPPYNYDPLELLVTWGQEFGSENIIVQPYEKEQLTEGILINFLNKTGIDPTKIQEFDPERDKFHVNVGFDRDVIEIFRMNKKYYRDTNDTRLSNLFSKYLTNTKRKAPFENYSIISPQQRLNILASYLPKYEIIAKKYLGRADVRLFYEPLPDPSEPWEPCEKITIDKFVPIYMLILETMTTEYMSSSLNGREETNPSGNGDLKAMIIRQKLNLSEKFSGIMYSIKSKNIKQWNIFIHIAMHTTGNSAIRRFLWDNRRILLEKGFLFLDMEQRYRHIEDESINENREEKFFTTEIVIKAIKKSQLTNVIISLENFEYDTNTIKLLKESFPDEYHIKIIYYARRQDELFEFIYNHSVRQPLIRLQETFNEFLSKNLDNPSLDYYTMLSSWNQEFGKENIIVRCCEKEQLPYGIFQDFLNVVGLSLDESFTIPKEKTNQGLNQDLIEIIRICNTRLKNDIKFHEFLINSLTQINLIGDDDEKQPLLSPQQRRDIISRFEESNTKVAHEYLGRTDGRLFYAPLPDIDEPWKPYEGLSEDEIIPVFTQLLLYLERSISRQCREHNVRNKSIGNKLKRFFNNLLR